MTTILVTRPEPQAELTALCLREVGYAPILAPAITLRALPDVATQVAALNHQVDGVVATSQFAIQILDANGLSRDLPLYVTGKALEQMARDYGFTTVYAAESNATSLLHQMLARPDLKKHLLAVVHGNNVAVDLVTPLADAGFRVHRQALYQSRPARTLPLEAITALRDGEVDIALFYSAFTAECFMGLAEQYGVGSTLTRITALAVSDTVRDALPASAWKQRVLSRSPAMEDMIVAIAELTHAPAH
jgi:uroporphyrinogen-III synthase